MSPQVITVITNINNVILNPIKLFLITLAIVVFLWGLVEFIAKSGSDTERETGKKHMLWGIIGIFIMISAIAIIRIFLNTFGIDDQPLQNVFLR